MRWNSRHGHHRTALSLARTDDGFAGSHATKSPTLNFKAVAFRADSLQDDNEKGPAFSMVPSMHHRVRSRVEGEGSSDKGNPASSHWQAGRFGLPRLDWLGSEPDRDGRRGSCAAPLSPATVSPPWTGHWSRFVKTPAFPGEWPSLLFLASGIDARRVKTRAAMLQRSRKPGPKGDAQDQRSRPELCRSDAIGTHQRSSRKMEGSANRASAEQPTKSPPAMQNICRQMSEGTASRVTPWTSA